MLTKTTLSAIRTLVLLAREGDSGVQSPRRIAEQISESPTYMAKVARLLVRAGLLHAEKGVKGGVRLAKAPVNITLLAIVEACQGAIKGDYCQAVCKPGSTCAFHHAAMQLQEAIIRSLSRWTLAQLAAKPFADTRSDGGDACVMAPEREALAWPL